MKIIHLQGSPKFDINNAILNNINTQQPGCISIVSFHPRNFVQMASDKPFTKLKPVVLNSIPKVTVLRVDF